MTAKAILVSVGLGLGLGLGLGQAHAEDPTPATFALVVGSNTGGPGQQTLKFAEDDAHKVADVLTELGGFAPASVEVVTHPTPQLVRDKLAQLAVRVQTAIAAGHQARVFFYYSGHARANAIDLGATEADELPLDELRTRLFAIPATLTVVVLDACQSGAFSRIKGATPAADFSFSSRQRLDASGIAVLASSSGSELSQESERLRGSYFTHHLLVGLRGAGDANGDGAVSIDEAYRYAYHQTLLATAETAVGGQHVSLEVDLKGHGEVPLSFPAKQTAAIVLPAALEGQLFVENRRAHAVVAEMYKAKGAAVRIAIAPGDYDVLVRTNGRIARCPITAGPAGAPEIDVARCPSEAMDLTATKGGRDPHLASWRHHLRVEVGGWLGGERDDAYTQTLANFQYHEDTLAPATNLAAAGFTRLGHYLWVGGGASLGSVPEWTRDTNTDLMPLRFTWTTTTALGLAQLEAPASDRGFGHHFVGYLRGGLGLGIARTHFTDVDGTETTQTYAGPAGALGAGFRIDGESLGFAFGYEYDYARIIDNNIGDTHGSGGHRIGVALSFGY